MPAKFRVKSNNEHTLYHIYNRGVDGRDVFVDENDYTEFLDTLKKYVTKVEIKTVPGFKTLKPSMAEYMQKMNLSDQLDMVAYCMMSNHIHLVIYQKQLDAIAKLMRRVMTGYGMYFNKKYKRRGPLWEGVYRAVEISSGEQLVCLTKYIHLNPVTRTVRRFGPVETITGSSPESYTYSSFGTYIGLNNDKWVNIKFVNMNSDEYKRYVSEHDNALEEKLKEVKID